MKKLLLLMALILAIFSSCESGDEILTEENNLNLKAKDIKLTDIEIYKNCVSSFSYNPLKSYNENVLLFEIHVNIFLGNNSSNYETINFSQLNSINNDSEAVFNGLTYRRIVKSSIKNILNHETIPDNEHFTDNELTLIQNLCVLSNEEKDYLKKNIKTIAFAYGSQYNLTKAILYTGAIDIKE